LAGALKESRRIGMPMGRESSLRMPLVDFQRLRSELAGAEFADATPLIRRLRMVKSEAEIATIGRICAIAALAFARAPVLFSEGQRLDEAFRSFKIELLRQGAEEVPYLVGGAGQSGYGDVISPPGAQLLEAGDVLMLDTGASLKGYFCDFDRNFAIRHADESARRAYRTLFAATDAGLDAARPGATCADIFGAMSKVIADNGGGDGDVGRLGHGLGMQLTEAPSLTGFDTTVLEEGMVLTLEPSLEIAPGKIMVHEENIVVRQGRPQLLGERAPGELPVL
jgi:Xaa-Pro aminopeptidase